MIYKDKQACADFDLSPAVRYERNGHLELCINCGKTRNSHYGWHCDGLAPNRLTFNKIPSGKRYLTKSMADSIGGYDAPARVEPDTRKIKLSNPLPKTEDEIEFNKQYAFFAAPISSLHCPCGILRTSGVCKYH